MFNSNTNTPQPQGERNTEGGSNAPGIYFHEGSKAELITSAGDEGFTQADALIRLGFERTGDVPSREEILAMQQPKEAVKTEAPKTEVKN